MTFLNSAIFLEGDSITSMQEKGVLFCNGVMQNPNFITRLNYIMHIYSQHITYLYFGFLCYSFVIDKLAIRRDFIRIFYKHTPEI